MASPQILTFFLFNTSTGAPLTGATPAFETYKDDTGSNITQPTITEIGGGAYKFTPAFTVGRGIAFVIDSGITANPRRTFGYLRPEDFNIDNADALISTRATSASITSLTTSVSGIALDVTAIKKIETNKWKIWTSGPDANKLVIYDNDGITPLYKFLLADASDTPTTSNPFSRTPA